MHSVQMSSKESEDGPVWCCVGMYVSAVCRLTFLSPRVGGGPFWLAETVQTRKIAAASMCIDPSLFLVLACPGAKRGGMLIIGGM